MTDRPEHDEFDDSVVEASIAARVMARLLKRSTDPVLALTLAARDLAEELSRDNPVAVSQERILSASLVKMLRVED